MVSPTAPTAVQQRLQQRKMFESSFVDEGPLSATISTSNIAVALGNNGKCVRKELLYKLGFENNTNGAAATAPSNREPSRGSLLGRVATRTEPLKYDANFDKSMLEKKERALLRNGGVGTSVFSALGALFSPQPQLPSPQPTETAERDDVKADDDAVSTDGSDVENRSTSSSANNSGKGGVSFNDRVTVIPIPKRDEYSKRIRDRLWVNAQDLQSQVARNAVEFAAEGWDWKQALDDEDMYVCALTGEKVHPVHCEPNDD